MTTGTALRIERRQVFIDQEKQQSAFGWMGWRVGMGAVQVTTSTINNGTLVFDIYNVSSSQLVWRGTVTQAINPSSNPQKNQQTLNKAIASMMKNYPPPVKK